MHLAGLQRQRLIGFRVCVGVRRPDDDVLQDKIEHELEDEDDDDQPELRFGGPAPMTGRVEVVADELQGPGAESLR